MSRHIASSWTKAFQHLCSQGLRWPRLTNCRFRYAQRCLGLITLGACCGTSSPVCPLQPYTVLRRRGQAHQRVQPPTAGPGAKPPCIRRSYIFATEPPRGGSVIPRSELAVNGQIDPTYNHNLRALFLPDGVPSNVRLPVLVPNGMNVYVGEQVNMMGGHASPDWGCHYVYQI